MILLQTLFGVGPFSGVGYFWLVVESLVLGSYIMLVQSAAI